MRFTSNITAKHKKQHIRSNFVRQFIKEDIPRPYSTGCNAEISIKHSEDVYDKDLLLSQAEYFCIVFLLLGQSQPMRRINRKQIRFLINNRKTEILSLLYKNGEKYMFHPSQIIARHKKCHLTSLRCREIAPFSYSRHQHCPSIHLLLSDVGVLRKFVN